MAQTFLSGHDGSVTMPSMHGGKAVRWSLGVEMTVKDISGYGDGRFRKSRGGLLGFSGEIACIAHKGTTLSSPNLTGISIDGVTLTLTSDTGCAHSGTALFTRAGLQHAHEDPAIPILYNYQFTGTVSESWATS